jgi:Family of unknown function (DUF6444)
MPSRRVTAAAVSVVSPDSRKVAVGSTPVSVCGEVLALPAGLDAARERELRLELRLAELERRLGMDSSDSGTPSSKERIGAKKARRARQQSERERRKDRKPGGQPGHQGKDFKPHERLCRVPASPPPAATATAPHRHPRRPQRQHLDAAAPSMIN